MRIGAVILARLDSRRLPGKALRNLQGMPLVRWAVETCRRVDGLDAVVAATSSRAQDDALADYLTSCDVPVYRGDCDDVAGRFLAAMQHYQLDGALRFNGDSPLNRPVLLDEAVSLYRELGVDLVSNVPGRSYPFGISAEVIGIEPMRSAVRNMTDAAHREHVTKYFYDYQASFRVHVMNADDPELAGVQLAVDDERDLARAAWIVAQTKGRTFDAQLAELVRLARQFDASAERSV